MENWIDTHITLPLYVTLSEEKENAFSHMIGALLSLAMLIGVLASSGRTKAGMIVYAISSLVLYTASALYHITEKGICKKVLRIFDHSSIYLLIAGSYTPVLLFIDTELTRIYTIAIWAAAFAGITLTILFWGRLKVIHVALYAVMGWSILSILPEVLPVLPQGLFPYILSGGITYTAGIFFYAMRKIPHNHLIWHIFVLAGSILFAAGYCSYLLA